MEYSTIGEVYDFIVEKHAVTGQSMSFPKVLEEMKTRQLVHAERPACPPFHAGMDRDAFIGFVRGIWISVGTVTKASIDHVRKETVSEDSIIPEGKDIFCLLNMPYMKVYPHYHPIYEINYVAKGSCRMVFEDDSIALEEGDLCITSPMSAHCMPLDPDCMTLSFMVRKSTFNQAFGQFLDNKDLLSQFFRNTLYGDRKSNYVLMRTENDPSVFSAVQELVYETAQTDEESNICAFSLLNLMLSRAVRAAHAHVSLFRYEGDMGATQNFPLILAYIQENYATVTLSSLAAAFNYSESYVSRLIHKNMNQTFGELLTTLRMNKARKLLANTSQKVSDIALEVGYDSVDHFTRTFKKVNGVTPREYRGALQP